MANENSHAIESLELYFFLNTAQVPNCHDYAKIILREVTAYGMNE